MKTITLLLALVVSGAENHAVRSVEYLGPSTFACITEGDNSLWVCTIPSNSCILRKVAVSSSALILPGSSDENIAIAETIPILSSFETSNMIRMHVIEKDKECKYGISKEMLGNDCADSCILVPSVFLSERSCVVLFAHFLRKEGTCSRLVVYDLINEKCASFIDISKDSCGIPERVLNREIFLTPYCGANLLSYTSVSDFEPQLPVRWVNTVSIESLDQLRRVKDPFSKTFDMAVMRGGMVVLGCTESNLELREANICPTSPMAVYGETIYSSTRFANDDIVDAVVGNEHVFIALPNALWVWNPSSEAFTSIKLNSISRLVGDPKRDGCAVLTEQGVLYYAQSDGRVHTCAPTHTPD